MRWALLLTVVACGPRQLPADGGTDGGAYDAGDAGEDFCRPLPEANCNGIVPTFTDLQPIFMHRCQTCHNGSGTEWPLVTYQHVADWQDQVRTEIVTCAMPPLDGGQVITYAEREAIFTWVRCGRPK